MPFLNEVNSAEIFADITFRGVNRYPIIQYIIQNTQYTLFLSSLQTFDGVIISKMFDVSSGSSHEVLKTIQF